MFSINEKEKNANALIIFANIIAITGYIISGLLLIFAIFAADLYINSSGIVFLFIVWAISNSVFVTIASLILKNKAYVLETLVRISNN